MRKSTIFSLVMSLLVLAFVMIAPSLAQNSTLAYGDTVTGEITNENYEVPYTFEGKAGDVIVVEMTMLEEGLDPYLQLKNAEGEIISFNDDGGVGLNSVMGPVVLPADGIYTIVATRYMQADGGSVGSFELTLSRSEISTIALNEQVTATLDAENTRVAFMYSNEGENILHLMGTTTLPQDTVPQIYIEVSDTEGNMLTSGYLDQQGNITIDPLYMTESGNYLFTLRIDPPYNNVGEVQPITDTMTVNFTISPVTAQPINMGDTVSGAVSLGESAYYTFTADAGTIVRLEGDQPEGETPYEVAIYNNTGGQFGGGGIPYDGSTRSFVNDPIRLMGGGNFLMVVRQINYGTVPAEGVSNYNVTLSLTQTPTLQSDVEVSGTVGGDTYEQVYRYEGIAGQTIRVTLTSTGQNFAPNFSIDGNTPDNAEETGYYGYLGSANSTVPGSVTFEGTLPLDGVYLIHISNGRSGANGPLVGNFSLLLEVVQ